MRLMIALFLLLIAPAAAMAAVPSVEVLAIHPASGQTLPRDTAVYVHLRYRSETELRVQVKGFRSGTEIRDGARWNPSPPYPSGSGEAIAWIAYTSPVRIDELRIEISDGNWRKLLILMQPAGFAWSGQPGQEAPRPEWVRRLSDAQQHATSASSKSAVGGGFDMIIGLVVMLSVPGYFVLQILCGLRWSGGWRLAALAPLLVMVPAVIHASFALSAGSNIWPIVVILAAPFGFLYLCLLAAGRFFFRSES